VGFPVEQQHDSNNLLIGRFLLFSRNRKALTKTFIYIFLLFFFIIYVTYFSQFVQFIFAASYFPISGNLCAYKYNTGINDCSTSPTQVNCGSGTYRPSFTCQATDPGCAAESASASCGAACTNCNGAGSCVSITCATGFGCASGSYCTSAGSCTATLANGVSCSDCSLNSECTSGNCGNGGASVCCDAGYRCCSTNADCLSGYTCVSNDCKPKSIPTLVLSNNTASVNTSNLVGYWRFEEGNGSTASDSSGNGNNGTISVTPKTVTSNGGASIDTSQSVFGGASVKFVATSSQYLSTSSSVGPSGTNSFTTDFWVNFTSLPSASAYVPFWGQYTDGSNYDMFLIYNSAGTYYLQFNCYGGGCGAGTQAISSQWSTPTTGVWYHIAFVRSGNSWYTFVNGSQVGSTASSSVSIPSYAANLQIGALSSAAYLNAHVDEVRFSNTARWTSNFTPPTSSYTRDSPTVLLLHMDGTQGSTTFTDDSNVTDLWTTGMFGNGLSFDGVSNLVNVTSSSSLQFSSSFSLEAWITTSSTASWEEVISKQWAVGDYQLEIASGKTRVSSYDLSPQYCDSLTSVNDGKFHHIVGVYSGSLYLLYVDGKLDNSCSVSGTRQTNTQILNIGGRSDGTYFNGTIDEVQIWNKALTASEINELYQSKVTYPTSTTFTGSNCPSAIYTNATDVTCNLYRNLTSVSNPDTATLGAGLAYYVYNTSGGTNWTANSILLPINVTKGTPLLNLTSNVSSPITYGTGSQLTGGNCTMTGAADITCTLYRGNTSASNSSSPNSVGWVTDGAQLGAGTYAYNFSSISGQNWTSASASNITLIVNKATQGTSFSVSPSATVTYPTSTTASCARTSGDSSSTITIYRNSTSKSSGTSSPQSETATLGAGKYNYTCVVGSTANYSEATSVENIVTVSAAGTISLSITLSPSAFEAFGTSTTAQGNGCPTSSDASDVVCKLYRNDSLVATSPTTSETITLGAGNYSYVYNTTGGVNYSSATSSAFILSVNPITPSLSVTFSPSSTNTYPTQTTASCSRVAGDPSSTLTLYRNGTQVASGTSSPQSETATLGAGNYNYTCTISSTQNYTIGSTLNNILTINPTTPSLSVSFSPSATNIYPTSTTAQCARVSGDSTSTLTLYRNGTQVASGTSSPQYETIKLGAAAYNYTCTVNAAGNYSAGSTNNNNLLINQNTSTVNFMNLTINGTEANASYTYPAGSNATGWFTLSYFDGPAPSTFTLYRNSTTIGMTNPVSDIQSPAAGAYNYTYYTAGNTNYSSASKNYFLTVGQIAPSISVSGVAPVTYPTQTTVSCGRVAGDPTSTLTLYRNGTQVASGTSSPQYETITLAVGGYNYTCTISATQNYTTGSSLNNNLIVNKGATLTRLFINGTEGNKNYVANKWANFTALLNVSGKTVFITSDMPGFVTQSGTTPLSYEKQMSNEGTWNITAYFNGDANYTVSSQTYYAIVGVTCVLKGFVFYADTGNPIPSGTVTYIVKETGETDYVSFTNGYFELPCTLSQVPNNRLTVALIVNSTDNKLGYVQLVIGGGPPLTQSQSCSTKQWHFNGTAVDVGTGSYITQGNITVSVIGTRYSNTTYFSTGAWDITISPCLVSGDLYTFQFAIASGNRASITFLNEVAK